MNWNPDFPAAFLLLVVILGLHAREIRESVFCRRFFSPERRRIEDVSRWWSERAEGQR
jgi:hypothetical protein